jgi:gamma-glutamylcyclotransferase (GGCT)/AIG2-like uncharacterized protein YtfP
MAHDLHNNARPWWAAADVAEDIQVTLDHVNQARERPSLSARRPGWELDACGDLFKALNRLWSTRERLLGDQSLSGSPAPKHLTALLKELTEKERTALLGMPSIEAFASFEPTIYDHSIFGETQRITDSTEETRHQAEADHRHFKENWSRWRDRGSGVSRVLEGPSRAILVVRNNLAHGEKTLVGPDRERAYRNRTVAAVVHGLLEDLLDFILGHPSQKLAVYGTLRPGQLNYGMLSDIDGTWRTIRLVGVLAETGLPTFYFSNSGSDAVEAELLISAELVQHWTRLDRFEGSGYTRQLGLVWFEDSFQVANVYVTSPAGMERRSRHLRLLAAIARQQQSPPRSSLAAIAVAVPITTDTGHHGHRYRMSRGRVNLLEALTSIRGSGTRKR